MTTAIAVAASFPVAPSAAEDCVIAGAAVADMAMITDGGGYFLVFYDSGHRACATSGTIAFLKKTIRMKDQVKLRGRGVNQEFVVERVPHEEEEILFSLDFSAGEFTRAATGAAGVAPALPVRLSGAKRGDRVKVRFGSLEKVFTVK